MGWGLAHSLFILLWDTSQLLMRSQPLEAGSSPVRSCDDLWLAWERYTVVAYSRTILWASHWKCTSMERGLHSGWSLVPDVPMLWGTIHRVGSHIRVDRRKVLIGCLSWHMLLCRDDTHTRGIWMVWVNCTTSAECKSIRIATSTVMDSWDVFT
jgi:hypothetical protein